MNKILFLLALIFPSCKPANNTSVVAAAGAEATLESVIRFEKESLISSKEFFAIFPASRQIGNCRFELSDKTNVGGVTLISPDGKSFVVAYRKDAESDKRPQLRNGGMPTAEYRSVHFIPQKRDVGEVEISRATLEDGNYVRETLKFQVYFSAKDKKAIGAAVKHMNYLFGRENVLLRCGDTGDQNIQVKGVQ